MSVTTQTEAAPTSHGKGGLDYNREGSKMATRKAAPAAEEGQPIRLTRIQTQTVDIDIVGVSPLIVNRWSEKAKRMMLSAQQGEKNPKEPKNPEQQYGDSMYLMEDGRHGFPATAFKLCTIGGARMFHGVTMTSLRSALYVVGEGEHQLVPIIGEPTMREDTVRLESGTADLRYRAQFWPWSATLKFQFPKSLLTVDSVVSLVEAGGMFNGVGEWRPQGKKGTGPYGRFEVSDVTVYDETLPATKKARV